MSAAERFQARIGAGTRPFARFYAGARRPERKWFPTREAPRQVQ